MSQKRRALVLGDESARHPFRRSLPPHVLRPDVVAAIEAGRFHIWAVDRIEEGIEVLTGVPAGGTRGVDGKYPVGSIFRRVEDRLEAFAVGRAPGAASGEAARIVMAAPAPPPTPGIPPPPPPEPPVSV